MIASVIARNDTWTGTANSGTRCRRQASTRSAGTDPYAASPAPSAVTWASASAATKVSLSAGVRRHIRPLSTTSPPVR